jgi:hypothetical protein
VSDWKAQRSQSKSWTKVIRSTHCGSARGSLCKYKGSNASGTALYTLRLAPNLLVHLIERDMHLPISRPWRCQARKLKGHLRIYLQHTISTTKPLHCSTRQSATLSIQKFSPSVPALTRYRLLSSFTRCPPLIISCPMSRVCL